MSVLYLLDTGTCIDLLRGSPKAQRRAAQVAPEDCAISTVTVYELLTGVRKCRHPERERKKVETLLSAIRELPFLREAAARAAEARVDLERQGVMIGPYDILLAGQALSAGLILVTANHAEFTRIKGLHTVDWRGNDVAG